MTILSIDHGDYAMRRVLLTILNRFSLGLASLEDLQKELLSNLQAILDSEDSIAIEAANELDSDLVQFGEGLVDDATLRARINAWIQRLQTIEMEVISQEASPKDEVCLTTSASDTVTCPLGEPLPVFRELGFAQPEVYTQS